MSKLTASSVSNTTQLKKGNPPNISFVYLYFNSHNTLLKLFLTVVVHVCPKSVSRSLSQKKKKKKKKITKLF